ncbi:MAG: gliding motility-associated ABC transporter ATP-binding subunit GldA [Bacteroidales bacterium]|nr:gliding motility-associated ABC transporter ATP-binding subunit GldA [Bacteroidales bacterium]
MSIKVKNITKIYGEQKALNNVSFEIKPGEIVGLLGPNGAGKTTMMKIITCFIPPTSGEVFVKGFDIFDQSIEVKRRIGYLPENNPLYTDMYVKEYLKFIAGIHKLGKNTKNRIKEIIDVTGIEIEQNKKIGALSKGYKQRVGLAQALIHNPEVLILDEPTSGLDPNQLVEIRNLIKLIGKEKTVILSTHIMQEVEAVCNRTIIINKGEIVADDKTENLYNTISNNKEIIKVEFDKSLKKDFLLKNIHGIIKLQKISDKIWQIEAKKDKQDIRSDIFKFAVDNNLTVLSMNKQEENLEKIFQKLTNT